jgi:hypothetical protein
MAAELTQPGVQVLQVFRAQAPTVVTPQLPACLVGVCRQIVDVTSTGASGGTEVNADARVAMAAQVATQADGPYAIGGRLFAFRPNNGTLISFTFSGTGGSNMTAVRAVKEINDALAAAGVGDALAETFIVGSQKRFRVRTVGTGSTESLEISDTTHASVLSALGVLGGYVFRGMDGYDQSKRTVTQANFPNPRGNLAELVMEASTLRAFVLLSGTQLREFKRDTALLLRRTYATVTGSVDLTGLTYGGGGTLDTLVLSLIINGVSSSVTFAAPANAAAAIAALNAKLVWTDVGFLAELSPTNRLVLTAWRDVGDASVQVSASSAVAPLGLTAAPAVTGSNVIVAEDDGNGDSVTNLLRVTNASFTTAATGARVRGTVDISAVDVSGLTLELAFDGVSQTLTFPASTNTAVETLAALNAFWPSELTATQDGSNFLLLTTQEVGHQARLKVVGGTAATALGLVAGTVDYGNPHPPVAGDDLYVNGALLGRIIAVAPGGDVELLRISKMVALSYTGVRMHVVAKNLVSPYTARPTPELVLDAASNLILKNDTIRDATGLPVAMSAAAALYVSYRAIRKDVTARARTPGLLSFSDLDQLEEQIGPVTTENPLALAASFALQNAPNTEVFALGVDAVAADAPEGTTEAYQRALEYIEAFDVYTVVPLSHSRDVGVAARTHVLAMSEPEMRGERIALFCPEAPTSEVDTLVASGTNGNSTGSAGEFNTGVLNLGQLLQAAEVTFIGTIPVSDGVFLDIGSDAKRYSVESISGAVVTLRTSFDPGDNDDGFYTTDAISTSLVQEDFALYIRGAELVQSDGETPDKQRMAETYQRMSQALSHRRFWQTMPDQAAATINAIEQLLEGYYLNAATAGAISAQPPQQSFTNFPINPFTRVIGSSNYFNQRQLNVVAAGGTYIYYQETTRSAVVSRHALTSDLTSVASRTDSVIKVVDFTAKFLRYGIKNFIGRFNIVGAFIDQISNTMQGLLAFLVENGVLVSFSIEQIVQDDAQPDQLLVSVILDVPFPCNFIRVTLLI